MLKQLFGFFAVLLSSPLMAQILVEDAHVRAMPPGVPNTAGYLQITSSEGDDQLLAARCEGVENTEMHTLLHEDGLTKMRPVAAIELPQGVAVILAQGGLHLMMMGLEATPEVGAQLSCELRFAKAPVQTVVFEVRDLKPSEHSHHHHH
ncbi:copper chaperone PCu(A)C [Ferrimonas gelatinilytica]|uniref:Copper chaperone PCu(A)C n=1 Tax=Ferrimonas gelatinilytica TaxID=1255257 RepID=A0ABP9S744_9GAMM